MCRNFNNFSNFNSKVSKSKVNRQATRHGGAGGGGEEMYL
jgi:hypothetical protein